MIFNRLLILCGCMIISNSYAGILTQNTRVIYEESMEAKSFLIVNKNNYPILVQAWVDNGVGMPDNSEAPFVILPAVFKMNPDAIESLKIIYNGNKVSHSKESVYWLNLYEIPGRKLGSDKLLAMRSNKLSFSMNTQLKLFFRPKGMTVMNSEEIVKHLKFSIKSKDGENYLVCTNPTPYNISFSEISINYNDNKFNIKKKLDYMTRAKSEQIYPLDDIVRQFDSVSFSIITDDGFLYSSHFYSEK